MLPDEDAPDAADDEVQLSLLDQLTQTSAAGRTITGRGPERQRPGQTAPGSKRIRKRQQKRQHTQHTPKIVPLCGHFDGFSLHARTRIKASERGRLEHLCKYILRPSIAMDRVSLREDGQVVLELPRAWRDGTTALVFDPLDFIGRLAPLIPAPGKHLVRYHGVLASAAKWRSAVVACVPAVRSPGEEETNEATGRSTPRCPASSRPETSSKGLRPRRLEWAVLLKRTFKFDVLQCARCGGRRSLIAVIQDPPVARAILEHLGLPAHTPAIAPSRAPPLAA